MSTVTQNYIIYSYDTTTSTASVTGFNSLPTNSTVIIPNSITVSNVSYSVKNINASAFDYCLALDSITIPVSVTNVGNSAFNNCSRLTSATIPDSVTYVGTYAFNSCGKLSSFKMPNLTKSINSYIFNNCFLLTSVTIPDSVTYIGVNAFHGCSSLRSVAIGNFVNRISARAFVSCYNLTSIAIPDSVTFIENAQKPFTGCVNLKTVIISSSNRLGITSPNSNVSFYDVIVNLVLPTVLNLYNSGYTVQQIITRFNNTFLQLYNAGITVSQLYNAGITVSQLYNAGITVSQLYNGGITVSQLYDAGITVSVSQLYNEGITVSQLYNGGFTVLQLYDAGISQTAIMQANICFPAGTPISTNQGNIPIELLDPEIHTIRNKKIVGVTQTITPDKYLVCFEKGALGPKIPSRKTIISKNHEILYNGKMTKAKDFVSKFENVKKIKYSGEVLYNVLMEEHDKMMVNNLICETLSPQNTVAQLYKILQTLNPDKRVNTIKQFNECVTKHKMYSSKN